MDAAYFSAFAALAGSVIGGLTSLGTSWLTQRSQLGAQRFSRNLERRETLYRDFIHEASRLYADAFEHDQTELSNLVKLFAMISQMRVVSSPRIAPRVGCKGLGGREPSFLSAHCTDAGRQSSRRWINVRLS